VRRSLAVDKLRGSLTDWLSIGDSELEQEYRRKNDKELAKEAVDEMMRNPPYKKMVQQLGTVKLNKGGSIDGCAIRGKTRGKFV